MIRELILKNRTFRRFYQDIPVERKTLEELVDLARCSASAANNQPLKYILVNEPEKNALMFPQLGFAGRLTDWPGPVEGERPAAYIIILLDEVWALLRAPGGAAAIENIARRSRKRRAALWMASQQIGEFLDKEHGRKILSVVGTKLLMGVSPFEANRMRDPFDLSDYLIDTLTKLGNGEAMLRMANAVLKVWIRSPKELELY